MSMADNTRVASVSIKNDKANWLKKQKEMTGLSESHFIDKGLDTVITMNRIKLIRLMLTPAFFFFVSVIFFIFSIQFSDFLQLELLLFLVLFSCVAVLLSGIGMLLAIRMWRRMK